ncbi:replication-associated protein [Capybara virus 31_cap3_4029]|nr:replication-associated protein [Capybara virus 31_cap3_4029]
MEKNLDGIDGLKSGEGNAKPSPAKQISQRIHWHFRFSNYEKHHIDGLDALFREICSDWVFQEEIGKEGTPHLQGAIRLKKEMRWTAFSPDKRIHWEPQISLNNNTYCCKNDDTKKVGGRVCFGGSYRPKEQEYKCVINKFYDWETEICNILKQEPDNRTLYWYWEENGCAGKTTFQKYIFTHYKNVMMLSGKGSDMKNGIVTYIKNNEQTPKIILINIPKSIDMNYVSYSGIEEVKDMFFYSGKYEGGMVCGPNPHIIIFANREPNYNLFSPDRWKVRHII